jgi:hypothetical protein
MVFWNQLEGNNVFVSGFDLSGRNRAPSYNNKMGFADGKKVGLRMSMIYLMHGHPQGPNQTYSSKKALRPRHTSNPAHRAPQRVTLGLRAHPPRLPTPFRRHLEGHYGPFSLLYSPVQFYPRCSWADHLVITSRFPHSTDRRPSCAH